MSSQINLAFTKAPSPALSFPQASPGGAVAPVVPGPPGPPGETVVSAEVVGTSLRLTTDQGRVVVVSGSILGPTGADGDSAYDVAVSNGFVGTALQWLASLVGAPGSDGADGADGRGITTIAHTAGTGAAGTTDTYTITFTDASTTTFQIVNGANGLDGADGSEGLDGAPGNPGDIGPAGPSAYEIAVANGFVGTEAAWLASLVGGPGPEGPPAFEETGPAFTYTSGLVSRIDYDSGNYKLFTYTTGVVTRIDYVRPGSSTIRKDFTYNPDGTLASIAQTEV